jgi:hypothetical protein
MGATALLLVAPPTPFAPHRDAGALSALCAGRDVAVPLPARTVHGALPQGKPDYISLLALLA